MVVSKFSKDLLDESLTNATVIIELKPTFSKLLQSKSESARDQLYGQLLAVGDKAPKMLSLREF